MNVNAVRELERILAQNKIKKTDFAGMVGLLPPNFSSSLKSEPANSKFFSKCAEALGLPSDYFMSFSDDTVPYLIPIYLQLIEEKDKRIALLEEQLELYRSQKNQE